MKQTLLESKDAPTIKAPIDNKDNIMKEALSVKNVSLNFGPRNILNQVSLSLYTGQVCILLGPNGAGKSSLLKLFDGSLTPQAGQVCLFSKDIQTWTNTERAQKMGVLTQDFSLAFNFTVREVIELGTMCLSLSTDALYQLTNALMAKLDLSHLAEQPYPYLSGGEKQRVHLARVLCQLSQTNEAVFMLDEPTSALDLTHQDTCLKLAQQKANQGAAVFVVLHDLNLAAQYGDRILLLKDGEIQADGNPWQVLTANNIKQVYGREMGVIKHPTKGYPLVVS